MLAKEHSLRFLCDEKILEIPFFQRAYIWKDDNWKDLLEDLLRNSGTHFLGSIILKRPKHITGTADKAIVIDGQQRLTTLSVLIKALYDSIENKGNKLITDATAALFYTLKSSDSDYLLTINHSHIDRKQFEDVMGKVVDGKIQSPILQKLDDIKEDDPKILIKRCYNFFYTELLKIPNIERVDLWDNLFDSNNKILVVIDLDDNDQEQKIFDTINSSGVRLSATDIIKNYVFQKYLDKTDKSSLAQEKVEKFYNETWEDTFNGSDDDITYWSTQKNVGRYLRDNSELLLQCFGIVTKYYDSNVNYRSIFDVENDKLDYLTSNYKKYIDTLNSEKEIQNFVTDLCVFSDTYREHIPEKDREISFEYDDVEKRLCHILAWSDNTTFNPYLLYLYRTHEGNPTKLQERLKTLERFVMYFMITGKSNKNFNKHCSDLINSDSDENKFQNYVKDYITLTLDNVLAGIGSKMSNRDGSIILFWIELKRRFDAPTDYDGLKFNYQLEHIMPQKWQKNWKKIRYVDNNGSHIKDEIEGMSHRDEKIFSLGNMTLLNGKLNNIISNSDFKTKLEGKPAEKGKKAQVGIKQCADLLITREDIINKSEWNEQTIYEREKKLAREIINIWGCKS